ncbi:hypothetical protein, conserved [Babesia bigemina]|uniref:WIBG Mago-binding domain-containing protein n=1 Tax=Babesia bigemina TaxID=5866 RepID=A0A061D745_BABBI|nr:hypothetical protein, conserved [Babesia bigemina]CDR96343.1 hypothetical protein, conserved [Babesia bigemina]|eukprot:XP_012768529.1 hypothetical protein, conserved [Babesia bigemina]
MSVDEIAESLSSLSLQGNANFRSARGEVYTVDTATGETFIKGTQRKDGSYRRDIKDEQGTYVPRFRRSPQTATPACIATDEAKKHGEVQSAEVKGRSWRSVPRSTDRKERKDIVTVSAASDGKTNEGVAQRRISDVASPSWRKPDSTSSRSANTASAVADDESAVSK